MAALLGGPALARSDLDPTGDDAGAAVEDSRPLAAPRDATPDMNAPTPEDGALDGVIAETPDVGVEGAVDAPVASDAPQEAPVEEEVLIIEDDAATDTDTDADTDADTDTDAAAAADTDTDTDADADADADTGADAAPSVDATEESGGPSEAPAETVPAEASHGLYEEIGSAGDWTAIRFQPTEDRTVCAIFSRPTDSIITENGNAIDALRGERAAFVTWESGTVSAEGGVFSAIVGAPIDDAFEGHSVETEKGAFTLFGHDDRLYVQAAEDAAVIAAVRGGLTLTLKATLPGGRIAQDSYSLRGVQASTELAKTACAAAAAE